MPQVPASPARARLAPDAEPISDAVRPRHVEPQARRYPIYDSATDQPLGTVTAADEGEVRDAVGLAADAAPEWAATSVGRRTAVLRGWANALRADADALAASITAETGTLAHDARAQVAAGIAAIERYAEIGARHRFRHAIDDAGEHVVERVPRGVIAVLLPWRDPVALACGQLAACLVSGNTVVVKPSGRAPLSVTRAVRRLAAPPGVVMLLHGGAETGSALADADEVDLVLHTGSVETGRAVAAASAARLSASIVERGGKGAVIVGRDADPEACAEYAAAVAFTHAGQLCGSVERLLVHRAVHDRFVAALLARTAQFRCGRPGDTGTTLGPLIDARQRATVHGQVTAAIAEGAHLRAGGALPHGPGCFYPPTVLDAVRPTMAVWSQKTFGPVAAVMTFDDLGEALRIAAEGGQRGGVRLLNGDDERRERAILDGAAIGTGAILRPGEVAGGLRRFSTGLGDGAAMLDDLTRWPVTYR